MKMIIRNKGNITIWFWLKFWSWSWCWSWSCSENQLPPLVLFLESNHTQTHVLFIFAFWPLESTFFCEKAAHRKEMRIRQKSYWRFNTSDARHCEASVWKCFKYNCQFPRLGPSRQMEGGKGGRGDIGASSIKLTLGNRGLLVLSATDQKHSRAALRPELQLFTLNTTLQIYILHAFYLNCETTPDILRCCISYHHQHGCDYYFWPNIERQHPASFD